MTWGLGDWQACPIGGQTGLKMLPRLTPQTRFPDGPTGLVGPMQPAGAMFRRMTGLPNTARRPWCPETASFPEMKTLQPVLSQPIEAIYLPWRVPPGRKTVLGIPYSLAKIGDQLAQDLQSLALVVASVGAPPLVEAVTKIAPVLAQRPGLEEQAIHVREAGVAQGFPGIIQLVHQIPSQFVDRGDMRIENVKDGWGAKRQSVFRAVAIVSQDFGQHQDRLGQRPIRCQEPAEQ